MRFCPLASGSKGNSIFLETKHSKILIDAGISAKSIKERLLSIDATISDIDAIFISHEHHDHIQGLKVLAFKHEIPIITNAATAKAICEAFHNDIPKFKIFTTDEPFEFNDLVVHPFSIKHDAIDPVGFAIQTESAKIGICTDLGTTTKSVLHHMMHCHILYVEANHEPDMVYASSRPPVYKERVLSSTGHLSNQDSAELISHVYNPQLKQVFLAHLSSECNTHHKARTVVSSHLSSHNIEVPITIALQDQPTAPIHIEC